MTIPRGCLLLVCTFLLLVGTACRSSRQESKSTSKGSMSPTDRAVGDMEKTGFRVGLHGVQGRFDLAQQSGATIQRAFLSWQKIEPEKGHYDFSRLDEVARDAGDVGIDTIVTMRALSEWGSSPDTVGEYENTWGEQQTKERGKRSRAVATRNSYPKEVDAWLRMLGKMVERYDGDGQDDMPGLKRPIRHWQIENEVSWQWKGPMSSYVKLLRQSREVMRKADPQAQIVLGAITAAQYFALDAGLIKDPNMHITTPNGKRAVTVEEVRSNKIFRDKKKAVETLFAEAGPYFDIADFHSYSNDAQFLSIQSAWMNSIMEKNGYTRPIWCLECGGPVSDYSEARHAEEVVKRLTVAFASRISTVLWSTLLPTNEFAQKYIDLSLVDNSGGKKAAFLAYQLMARMAKECTEAKVIETSADVYAYELSGPGGKRYWVGWAIEDRQRLTVETDAVRRVQIYQAPYSKEKSVEVTVKNARETLPISTHPVVVESVD
ncbi:MAG: hypothetical protein GW893_03465 [Armatimonadetes bacterium]|nr:hypothetical protein [Armatimonadota bacterium]PIU65959.1 MAG: hypothetical protein COS85_06685 [Armatimonadetes bacterium CG07_land_8_20_14_0_80_59_28]PIX42931.1 MAG: hypothetical protein COZ56_08205 [Armatimonadetes bacterium CG_4_8_14_3_um_filter_58_9]